MREKEYATPNMITAAAIRDYRGRLMFPNYIKIGTTDCNCGMCRLTPLSVLCEVCHYRFDGKDVFVIDNWIARHLYESHRSKPKPEVMAR